MMGLLPNGINLILLQIAISKASVFTKLENELLLKTLKNSFGNSPIRHRGASVLLRKLLHTSFFGVRINAG